MAETKTARIDIRVTQTELNKIRASAHALEMTISEYLLFIAAKDRGESED